VSPVSPILAHACLNARFIASIWPAVNDGALPRFSSLFNLEASPFGARSLVVGNAERVFGFIRLR
jgi:hypothetical protein